MGSIAEISQLCRLCLVKDKVNIPIFDKKSDRSRKIESCLPVKVSRTDNLPKKICDGCSNKLDLLYTFRNTSLESEQQLISWLNEADKDPLESTTKPEIMVVKQETFDTTETRIEDDKSELIDSQNYMLEQDQLEEYEQDFTDFGEASGSMDADDIDDEEPLTKKSKKTEDNINAAMQIMKAEEEDEDVDQPDYVEAGSSGINDQQPESSGTAATTATEAPSDSVQVNYICNTCLQQFQTKSDFFKHHIVNETFKCCKCDDVFTNINLLYTHLEEHNSQTILVDENGEVMEEVVLNCEDIEEGSEGVYVLDESQCVNEVVIEEDLPTQQEEREKNDNLTIVQLEHGYVMPNVSGEVEEVITLNGKQKTISARKVIYTSTPRQRTVQPKKRQVVPDFSATNYLFINANEEVDFPHYKCLRCEQLFISKFVFFRHIERGKCYINNCDVCSASFERNSDFYQHYISAHTDRAICNFCFRTFMYEKNVKEHMMRHLDQFRHRCEECNKGFYTVREYRNHYKNRHMGIRHTCTVCSRSFADEYYFRRHVATHGQTSIVIE